MNAHINYDLPQALIAVIPPEDFARRAADGPAAPRPRAHRRRAARRVAAEDAELERAGPARSSLDRVMQPLNQAAVQAVPAEARTKVWHNTPSCTRRACAAPAAYADRLGDLEVLSAARVDDLLRAGAVLVRLAFAGFGVTLPRR